MTNQREIVPGICRPPRKEDYFDVVRGLRPLCQGEELILRSSLLLMRDRAMATKEVACQSGYALLEVVEREASGVALNPRCTVEDLREFQRLCIRLVSTAQGFDMLYQPHIPGIEGESAA